MGFFIVSNSFYFKCLKWIFVSSYNIIIYKAARFKLTCIYSYQKRKTIALL
jgi:hypothetical protein